MKISREVKTAILVIFGIIFLIFGINYLKGKNLLESTNVFYTEFNYNALTVSSPITIKGNNIGKVNSPEEQITGLGECYLISGDTTFWMTTDEDTCSDIFVASKYLLENVFLDFLELGGYDISIIADSKVWSFFKGWFSREGWVLEELHL